MYTYVYNCFRTDPDLVPQRHRLAERRTTCHGSSALCGASRGKNEIRWLTCDVCVRGRRWESPDVTDERKTKFTVSGISAGFYDVYYWSPRLARSLLFFIIDSVCLSVCLSVCHKHCFFFFVSQWNRAISWPSVFHDKNYKTLFFDFWFRPRNAQNLFYSPKFDKIAYKSVGHWVSHGR